MPRPELSGLHRITDHTPVGTSVLYVDRLGAIWRCYTRSVVATDNTVLLDLFEAAVDAEHVYERNETQ